MFEHGKLQDLEDYFTGLDGRPGRVVYFYRINGYNDKIKDFLLKYYTVARQCGVVIEGRIPNPEERHLNYYEEIMGMDFQTDAGFITKSLQKWLPRMNDAQRSAVASSIHDTLADMRRAGKNDHMLKNAYIKFMCWLYYRFERIVNRLGTDTVPKILYDGDISNYELKLLTILSKAGSDILLLQYRGDGGYLKLDPASALSCCFAEEGMSAFPEGFAVRSLQKDLERQWSRERLYGAKPQVSGCTNAWIEGTGLKDAEKDVSSRGNDPQFFYNCFIKICGVEDKVTYLNELYQFRMHMKACKRRMLVLEGVIPHPTAEEINAIQRKNYQNAEQMLLDLLKNIGHASGTELEGLMRKAFIDIMSEEADKPGMSLNRLTNKAVYLLCWLKRYRQELFGGWKLPDIGCLVCLGGCQNENEALFLRLVARLPADVLLLLPDLRTPCCLEDPLLYEIRCSQSLPVDRFPQEGDSIQMGTAAYHAEQELDEVLYQDSGLYRNQQYEHAVSVTLRTMYEEIAILWDQEVKYRPNFSVTGQQVNIPVLFAKVSGVKDKQTAKYWSQIRSMVTEDTLVIREAPYIDPAAPNPMKTFAPGFFKNRRLLKSAVKSHASYPYGHLRADMQDHILDKLELLIEQRIIKGTFENGTEYTIIATVLNLGKEITRMLQRFDFTKKNPKLVYINTTEKLISLEDSILAAFLNLAGFDVVFFIPTGYQSIEKYFGRPVVEEHQAGEYMYDLRVPALGGASSNTRRSWREKIFKRGN